MVVLWSTVQEISELASSPAYREENQGWIACRFLSIDAERPHEFNAWQIQPWSPTVNVAF